MNNPTKLVALLMASLFCFSVIMVLPTNVSASHCFAPLYSSGCNNQTSEWSGDGVPLTYVSSPSHSGNAIKIGGPGGYGGNINPPAGLDLLDDQPEGLGLSIGQAFEMTLWMNIDTVSSKSKVVIQGMETMAGTPDDNLKVEITKKGTAVKINNAGTSALIEDSWFKLTWKVDDSHVKHDIYINDVFLTTYNGISDNIDGFVFVPDGDSFTPVFYIDDISIIADQFPHMDVSYIPDQVVGENGYSIIPVNVAGQTAYWWEVSGAPHVVIPSNGGEILISPWAPNASPGYPGDAGEYNMSVMCETGSGINAYGTFHLSIIPANSTVATVGQTFTYTVSVVSGETIRCTPGQQLPPYMTIVGNTLTGIPQSPGAYQTFLDTVNSNGVVTEHTMFNLYVN